MQYGCSLDSILTEEVLSDLFAEVKGELQKIGLRFVQIHQIIHALPTLVQQFIKKGILWIVLMALKAKVCAVQTKEIASKSALKNS